MTAAVSQIVARLGSLSQEERVELARAVLLSLEPEEAEVEGPWHRQPARR